MKCIDNANGRAPSDVTLREFTKKGHFTGALLYSVQTFEYINHNVILARN